MMTAAELQAMIKTLDKPVERVQLYCLMRREGFSKAFAGYTALGIKSEFVELAIQESMEHQKLTKMPNDLEFWCPKD